MSDGDDRVPLVTDIFGRRSLIKPPFSARLRAGSVTLAPGEAIGSHRTDGREEALVVIRGTATLVCAGETYRVAVGQFAYVPPETEHDVLNETSEPVVYAYLVAPVGDAEAPHDHDGVVHTH